MCDSKQIMSDVTYVTAIEVIFVKNLPGAIPNMIASCIS